MARLPQIGGDSGNWGSILNEYLSQSHNDDGSLRSSAVKNILINGDGVTLTHDPIVGTITLSSSVTAGVDGQDGRAIELQNDGTFVQWRYVGDTAWANLVELESIRGPQGLQGEPGTPNTIIPQLEAEAAVATTLRAISAQTLARDINYRINQRFVVLEATDPAGTDPNVIYFRKVA